MTAFEFSRTSLKKSGTRRQTISATEPQKTQVVTAETARGFRKMLREVVSKARETRAIKRLYVGGKNRNGLEIQREN
jgi:membrane peptidoglycan carboxypeptidase